MSFKNPVLLIVWLCLASAVAVTQPSLRLKEPSPLSATREDLLDPTILNPTGETFRVYLRYQVWDAESNIVADIRSEDFALSNGTILFNHKITGLYNEDYYDDVFEQVFGLGYFPFGNYSYCVELIKYEAEELLDQKCKRAYSAPIQRLRLVYPVDQAVLKVKHPALSWTPIQTPYSFAGDIEYDITIKEVLSGQTHLEAYETNDELHQASGLKFPFYVYPSSANTLDTNKHYVWHVRAFVGSRVISESEVWAFQLINDPNEVPLQEAPNMITLRRELDGNFYIVGENLKFNFEGEYSTQSLKLEIFDDAQKQVNIGRFSSLVQKYGDNYYLLELNTISGLASGKYYTMVVANEKGELSYLRFKYHPYNH